MTLLKCALLSTFHDNVLYNLTLCLSAETRKGENRVQRSSHPPFNSSPDLVNFFLVVIGDVLRNDRRHFLSGVLRWLPCFGSSNSSDRNCISAIHRYSSRDKRSRCHWSLASSSNVRSAQPSADWP